MSPDVAEVRARNPLCFDFPEGTPMGCLHCGRSYVWGDYREEDGLMLCPHAGCEGDIYFDGYPLDWRKRQ